VLIALFFIIFIFGGITIYENRDLKSSNNIPRKLPIYCVGTDEKKVAITFDTSWGQDHTKEILDILKQNQIKATFFVVGRWAEEYPNKVKEIAANGHEIGNHSDKHSDFTKLSKNDITNDIAISDAKIAALTGARPVIFRFPEGNYNDLSVDAVIRTGHTPIQWDVDSIDWKNQGYDIEYNRVINKVKPGSIILFHNTGAYTTRTLPKIIEKLKKDGYSFVKITELIYNNNYTIDNYGKQMKN
jgi:polysaccharide deacetylase family sporulation protein PdaB